MKVYLIGTWHDVLEEVLLQVLNRLADSDKNINLLVESRRYYNKERYMENTAASLLGWITEFILLSKDPTCMYPVCHGYKCDISTRSYYIELFGNIALKLDLLCTGTTECPPDYNASDWITEVNSMDKDTYIIDPIFLLEKFINPTLDWLQTSKNIELSPNEWNQMFKQIDYIVYNRLCEEDFLVVSDFLLNFSSKARERHFAKLIANKYFSPTYNLRTIYVQVGALHLKGVIKELNVLGIDDIKTTVIKNQQDLIEVFKSTNLSKDQIVKILLNLSNFLSK